MLNTEEYERIKMEKRLLEKINEAEDAVKNGGLSWSNGEYHYRSGSTKQQFRGNALIHSDWLMNVPIQIKFEQENMCIGN